MKVLEEGKWKNPWSKEYVCQEKSCEAKLLVEEGDLKPRFDEYYKNYFICPCCGKETDVPAKDLPPRVLEKANKRRKYREHDW